MKTYLISIDDTDDVTKSTSTGKIAELIGEQLKEYSGRVEDGISRHQLLLSDEIAYTSHNSSMCIDIEIAGWNLMKIAELAERIIRENMAPGSDPGLAVCELQRLDRPEELITFGFEAKRKVKTKGDAYTLAAATDGVILKELGGSGIGVIGALAGIGLRLSRSDGSLRGKEGEDLAGLRVTAGEICRRFGAEMVVCGDGTSVEDDTGILVDKFIKLMYFDGHKCCIVRRKDDGEYVTVHQHQEREKFMDITGQAVCSSFTADNDEEEYALPLGAKSCFNCLYRRWIHSGFRCMKEEG